MSERYDFSGYATRYGLRCSDGRTICKDAFKDNAGKSVPLVWQHMHNDPMTVIGHAMLESRPDGMYAYCSCNDSETGRHAKEMVRHGDITALSIYANKLKQNGGDVIHGAIREVSLVLTGANPGAVIDFPILEHSGEYSEDEAKIYIDEDACCLELAHEDKKVEPEEKKEEKPMADNKERTVKDVFDSMTEEQKNVVYFMIGQALEDAGKGSSSEAEHSYDDGGYYVKHNAFDDYDEEYVGDSLSHAEIQTIFSDMKRFGSLKESFLQHSGDYGIDNIEYLFPDAKTMENAPTWIKRNDEWVDVIMKGTHHTPFSRIKSIYANITADEARAKGYIKGNLKTEEVFPLLKRTTQPTTIYKKQKLDRDDIIDITDFDVVAWLKTEMRIMLDEEIARAVLIGDGRTAGTDDKISEDAIRPIWTDSTDLYTINQTVEIASDATPDEVAHEFIRQAIKGRKNYKGTGNPILFTTEDVLTDCLLMEDLNGRIIYDTQEKLATALRVSKIVTVPLMESKSRVVSGDTRTLMGIIVNPNDYTIGADKGGSVNMFDDFDIDYNQQKYLIETRCSGSLTTPFSAIILESVVAD